MSLVAGASAYAAMRQTHLKVFQQFEKSIILYDGVLQVFLGGVVRVRIPAKGWAMNISRVSCFGEDGLRVIFGSDSLARNGVEGVFNNLYRLCGDVGKSLPFPSGFFNSSLRRVNESSAQFIKSFELELSVKGE